MVASLDRGIFSPIWQDIMYDSIWLQVESE